MTIQINISIQGDDAAHAHSELAALAARLCGFTVSGAPVTGPSEPLQGVAIGGITGGPLSGGEGEEDNATNVEQAKRTRRTKAQIKADEEAADRARQFAETAAAEKRQQQADYEAAQGKVSEPEIRANPEDRQDPAAVTQQDRADEAAETATNAAQAEKAVEGATRDTVVKLLHDLAAVLGDVEEMKRRGPGILGFKTISDIPPVLYGVVAARVQAAIEAAKAEAAAPAAPANADPF